MYGKVNHRMSKAGHEREAEETVQWRTGQISWGTAGQEEDNWLEETVVGKLRNSFVGHMRGMVGCAMDLEILIVRKC